MELPIPVRHLKIRDLLIPDEKRNFLIGAGFSIDKPSCLPIGRNMIKVNYQFF